MSAALRILPVWLIAGILTAHQFDALAPRWLVIATIVVALGLLSSPRFRLPAFYLFGFCWCLWQFQHQLDDRLDSSINGSSMRVEGLIADIPQVHPDYTKFRFTPAGGDVQNRLPTTLLVYWYRDAPQVRVGERWRLGLQVRPPWGRINFQGPDRERWLFSEGIGALATVRSGERLSAPVPGRYPLQQMRGAIKERMAGLMPQKRPASMVQALSIADRSGLADADRRLLVATGTSHLLAISGLHIGLAAAGGLLLARLAFAFLPMPPFSHLGLRGALACGLLSALAYSALAGWGVSTQRAVVMIFVAMATLALGRATSPLRAYLLAMAAVLVLDPLAPLGTGFWFSFAAVAILLYLFVPRLDRLPWWKSITLAQAGVMLMMLPLSAYWFGLFSPVGFLANLLAIPWVSFMVVPLVLAGVFAMLFSDGAAAVLLNLAGLSAVYLLDVLSLLSRLQGKVPELASPGYPVLLLASLGGLVLLLPAGFRARWMGLFLLLPLFFPDSVRPQRGSLLIEALDAGQGTAVLVSTGNRTLLYDSGPGNGKERNLVSSVITPALTRLGRSAPDRIVISHADLDHAGGLGSLRRLHADASWNANLPGAHSSMQECRAGLNWQWEDHRFEVLHPSAGLPYLGNDSSCVLSVKGAVGGFLLSGDISAAVEKRLSAVGLNRHKVLLVPHHGSLTSSGSDFISAVDAEVAIATAGLGNRFGFPRKEVRDRYLLSGAEFWSTGACGAIRLELDEDGSIHASSARRERNRIWRWPAGRFCP